MQFWGGRMEKLTVWTKVGTDETYIGDAVPKYQKGRKIQVAKYVSTKGQNVAMAGIEPTETYSVITHTSNLRVNDALGDDISPIYRITSVAPYCNGQSLTLERIPFNPEMIA